MGNSDQWIYLDDNRTNFAAAPPERHRVAVPPPKPFLKALQHSLKETLFPDDPLRKFKNQPPRKKFVLGLQYFFPILEWGPRYTLNLFKSDLIAGITIASLAIPQGISYAKLANVSPVLGLYSSFVPPLIYAIMGTSRDIAVGTVAVGSLLMGEMINEVVHPKDDPELYLHLFFTATFFTGIFQSALGIFRLGFIVDILSHPTIEGFMGGTATVVILQQMKNVLGLEHFTTSTDVISVVRSLVSQFHLWRWEPAVMGGGFLAYLLLSRYISKKKSNLFWVSAIAPLTSVIVGSLVVYLVHGEHHGIRVIGELKKGINPISILKLNFNSRYLPTVIRTGIVTGTIAMAEGIAIGRSFAALKNYHVDGNKEMAAFGFMNLVGSFTSCYLTTGIFSRSAVNYNAGCKTAVSNIVMAITVLLTLLFLIPYFHYTPQVVLSAIIMAAMLGLIHYDEAIHLWHVDKYDFLVCMSAFFGVVFGSFEIGLLSAAGLSILRILLTAFRPKTSALGNIPDSTIFRNPDHYEDAERIPGYLIIEINGPIYFANSNYLRERISRWIEDEEDRLKLLLAEERLQYVILEMSAIGNIDSSGTSMLKEVKKIIEGRGLKLAFVNPGAEVLKKMDRTKLMKVIGEEWMFLTIGDAIVGCNLQTKPLSIIAAAAHV